MNIAPAHPESAKAAAEIIRAGGVCAFATETVYGLGADATNPDAVLGVYATKGRPRFNPLIVHCASVDMARSLADFNPLAERLAAAFWPGPLTLVLPRKPGTAIADVVTAGLTTIALRVPAHEGARDLIARVGRPVAAPSANPSGTLSPTTAEQVRRAYSNKVPVLDGGCCSAGLESTIIAVDGERLVQLRAGALARAEIAAVAGRGIELAAADAEIAAPGMLKSHYAPQTPLRLMAFAPHAEEAFLAFGPTSVTGPLVRNLSASADLTEAARNFFAMLHELDALGAKAIAVMPIPESGLGEAINDRLRRAVATG